MSTTLPAPVPPAAPEGGVVVWRVGDLWQAERPVACSCDGDPEQGPHTTEGDAIIECRVVPVGEFTALAAYAETGEAVEGVLIEANLDDCETTPAETVRALLARANTAKVAAELMRARAEKAEAALNRVDRALWDVIGCVEDLNDCEGWHNSDPCSRSGKLNAACEVARAALSTQRGEGGA